ncbi:hypothetical protein SF83666_a43350 (plasmid) [Sinorhizobium fredii CCBAU 83666]|nr:hypothetical protein SF83666_a43350 [Sinorhizobium fredii CCBAU 83666]
MPGGDFTSPLIIFDGFDRPSFIYTNYCKRRHLSKEAEKATCALLICDHSWVHHPVGWLDLSH